MTTIDKSKPVLVTGATGYVAGWLVKKLLDEAILNELEFCVILQISEQEVSTWIKNEDIPYWVETWLLNYIDKINYKKLLDEIMNNDTRNDRRKMIRFDEKL